RRTSPGKASSPASSPQASVLRESRAKASPSWAVEMVLDEAFDVRLQVVVPGRVVRLVEERPHALDELGKAVHDQATSPVVRHATPSFPRLVPERPFARAERLRGDR